MANASHKVRYMMTRYVEKFDHGEFSRVRARTLLGGNEMLDDYCMRWDEISARTISAASLNVIIALAAYLGMDTGTMDHESAFLLADLPEEDQCFAKVPKVESQMLIRNNPAKWQPYLDEDGHIYVRVVKALYGHPKAPILWYNHQKEKLATLGFRPLLCDQCVYIRFYGEKKFDLIGVHVDDSLMVSLQPNFFTEIQKLFLISIMKGKGTLTVGPNLDYLSLYLQFNKADRSCYITQEHYWNKIIKKVQCHKLAKCPHKSRFMERLRKRSENDEEIPGNPDLFLSIISSILWGAKTHKN